MRNCSFLHYFLIILIGQTLSISPAFAQGIPTPNILEVKADDRVATLYWNSKTNIYHSTYDPDKQQGISSYMIEWGKQSEGYTNRAITPYRAHMIQPLEPGVMYVARVYNLDNEGQKSAPSASVSFQHDPTRVNDMRSRLTGFFDDMNYPMGAFPEKDWNQAYSGCVSTDKISQHINNQFHGHNVVASGACDRGIASSRLRHPFDFSNRTGVIEFDLDGSQKNRQFWYLDLSPFDRKRDLSGHVALNSTEPVQADPAYMLRILERGSKIFVQLADDQGNLKSLDNMYRNGACGDALEYCNTENLEPLINVRRHWRIELSKSEIKIFINGILVVDCSLLTPATPTGLPYEVAQINWLLFSYNTTKENILLSMIHWDNFGIDAPIGYQQSTVVHNYTDGQLGSDIGQTGNEPSIGLTSQQSQAGLSIIPIPDPLQDLQGNPPLSAELMFTIQGGDYTWSAQDSIVVNGNSYMFPKPSTSIANLSDQVLISSIRPHSVALPIDPAHLIQGNNQISFYLSNPRLLNIHVELIFPINQAPSYTPPSTIFNDHLSRLMNFRTPGASVGPGIVFTEIDAIPFWQDEFSEETNPRPGVERQYVKQTPVSDSVLLIIAGNSLSQLAATGKSSGIAYYEIWMDEVPIQTVRLDAQEPVASFKDTVNLDISSFSNGTHELFIQAYDVNGKPSVFDAFQAHSHPGEYMPIVINIRNNATLAVEYASFIAFEREGLVELRWESHREIGSDYYLVERSIDAQVFEQIGQVGARGSQQDYAFTDRFAPKGKLYYRLKEIDVNGNYTYSEIRTVLTTGGMSLRVSPNPWQDYLEVQVKLPGHDRFTLELLDLAGKRIKYQEEQSQIQQTFSYRFNTQNLSTGVYIIKIQADTEILYKKLYRW